MKPALVYQRTYPARYGFSGGYRLDLLELSVILLEMYSAESPM